MWKRTFKEGASQVMITEDKLLVNNHDLTLYALDPLTGYYLWTAPVGGGCSPMQAHNGIVYYTNGSDGLLYAVQVEDGEVLWSYENPDRQKHEGAFFGVAMGMDKEGEHIYTHNHLDALCFETLKE